VVGVNVLAECFPDFTEIPNIVRCGEVHALQFV
jgi:hypothetical protein